MKWYNKTDRFEGSLFDLFEFCSTYLPNKDKLISTQNWLIELIKNKEAPFIVRKHSPYNIRGKLYTVEDFSFYGVDNEPLNSIYDELLCGNHQFRGPILDYLQKKRINFSWYIDEGHSISKSEFKCGGVKTSYRAQDLKMKLAHIFDAAKGIEGLNIDIRFFRTLNPLNIFPFPSSRSVHFDIITENTGIIKSDIAEDKVVQNMMLAYIKEYINDDTSFNDYIAYSNIPMNEIKLNDALEMSKNIKLSVTRRSVTKKSKKESVKTKKVVNKVEISIIDPIDKIPRRNELKSLDELYIVLKEWRKSFPDAPALCGFKGTCGTPWIYFRHTVTQDVSVFRNIKEIPYNQTDYDRGWHLNGDTKSTAIDEFIYLFETDINIEDILLPEVTGVRNNPSGPAGKKPRLKLGDDPNVSGVNFYCYN